jgi:hypothetical protein
MMTTEQAHETHCVYCGSKLNLGYHFTCHVCRSAYCFIHMSKHDSTHPRSMTLSEPSLSAEGPMVISSDPAGIAD